MDVAAASGVSYATVSRYLNGNPHVSAKAAERIAAAVKQVNYTPNNAARSLVRQRTQTVAFVVHGQPDSLIADPNISTILLNANQTLGNADYQLITLISVSPAAGARIARLASSGFADGWILNTFHKDDPLFQGFANISVPVAISGVGYGGATPFPHRRHRQPTRFTQAHRAYVGARVSANRLYHRTVVLADADAMHPQLTTVRQPMDAFGVSLSTLVLGQIEGRPFQRTVFLPTEVLAR